MLPLIDPNKDSRKFSLLCANNVMPGPELPFENSTNATMQLPRSGQKMLWAGIDWIGVQVMPQLPLEPLPSNDSGRLLVRLNIKYRAGIPRYGIGQLKNSDNGKSVVVLFLGHDNENAIFMPYDIRDALGVNKRAKLEFSIQKVGLLGKINWLLKTPDPAVHVPAWLALTSVCLGALGVAIALCS